MVLTGLNEEVQDIFAMEGFSALFQFAPNPDAAHTRIASSTSWTTARANTFSDSQQPQDTESE